MSPGGQNSPQLKNVALERDLDLSPVPTLPVANCVMFGESLRCLIYKVGLLIGATTRGYDSQIR